MQFKAEEFADFAELQALCRLVGPYGVKVLDREVMRYITENISGIKVLKITHPQHFSFRSLLPHYRL